MGRLMQKNEDGSRKYKYIINTGSSRSVKHIPYYKRIGLNLYRYQTQGFLSGEKQRQTYK
jgi:hypothetical protein